MRINTILLLLALAPMCRSLMAQSTISGAVTDARNQPLEFVNITLHRSADSVFVKGNLSDAQGRYELAPVDNGEYFIRATLLGYDVVQSPAFAVKGQSVSAPDLALGEKNTSLGEVTVSAEKPFIERTLDKLIVNVENSIVSAGASVLEVLEHSPNILVDQEGNISLRGRQGVIVMLDDKRLLLSGAELANMLRGMPSSSIEKIEIITNPSAKYDAEGNAGIINLKTKKDQRLGTNGNLLLSGGHGKYPKATAGFDLNHRSRRLNLFAGYNYSYNKYFNNLVLFRKFSENGAVQQIYDQDNFIAYPNKTHTPRLGLDYTPSDKTTVGMLFTAVSNRFKPAADNESYILAPDETILGRFTTTNRSRDQWDNVSGNLNLRHNLGEKNGELSADLDYARYWNSTDQLFNTRRFDSENVLTGTDYLRGDIGGFLNLYSAKADYSVPLGKSGKLEAGVKSSLVKTDNDLKYFILQNGEEVLDDRQSNHFLYDENINAGYLNWSREWKKWNMQVGLRGEQTVADGNQVTTDSSFHRNYFQLFPSAFLNYTPSEKHTWGVSVSRRINRPNYQQLNPFRAFVDPTTFREGNPFLQPQLTYSLELTHTFRQRFNTTLGYSTTSDNITYVLLQNDQEKSTIVTNRNIDRYEYFSLAFNAPFSITKWWTLTTDLNFFYHRFAGEVAGFDLDQSSPVFYGTGTNTFRLPGGWTAELSGFYHSSHVFSISTIKPFWMLNAGVQKTLWDGRGTLRLNVRDIFWRGWPRGSTQFGNIDEVFKSYRESRVGTLALSYRFGKKTVQQARRRQTGAEEEKRRATSGG
ncbi:MAG: TonB-dependent receptor [Lewinellaceae bacterium]|nr:TonB-dependent receptor [Lewinellaceae bacterium]